MSRRLLALCVTDVMSGGERYLVRLVEELAADGWDTTIATRPGPLADDLAQRPGIRSVTTQLGPKLGRSTAVANLGTWRQQREIFDRLITSEKPDVVLLQYKLEQLLWGGRRLGPRFVLLEHGPVPGPILKLPVVRRAYRRSARLADATFAASTVAARDLRTAGAEPCLLPAGVDAPRNVVAAPGRRRGLYAGRLETNKGVLEAIDLVLRSPGFSLTVAGTGTLSDRVAELARLHPESLNYVGYSDDVVGLINTVDFGILLSSDPGEGRPLFALECLASNRPVIGSSATEALQSLWTEFGEERIRLVDAQSLRDVVLREEWIRPVSVTIPGWDETAKVFARRVSEQRSQ
ncbi:glycosyltransferase [Nocardioides rubriscoriae]|uniref:glycosyltransferase n=1 Tax=Nocardioides rubriscoriae TaxID=642762 RepID=UPI0011DF3ECD|nr:glycosyltransferase [Nocardioides rubriscoriae]